MIFSPDQYIALWMEGFQRYLDEGGSLGFGELYSMGKKSPALRQYLKLFLQRSYLKHYDELYKKRPVVEEAEIWVGQNNADYGLLVTPRFRHGRWENDKSEIRHFKPRYWTIGHVLMSGLVVPNKKDVMTFATVEDYLKFFENVLVRDAASSHQAKIAAMYSEFVRTSNDPLNIPLLIPEFRYNGRDAKHEHRLDFCVINPDTLDRVGFELSPWSTHGRLRTKDRTGTEINEEAKANFEKEMKRLKKFFKKHGITALVYTDTDLAQPETIFSDIRNHLEAAEPTKQLRFDEVDEFFQ